MLYPLSVLLFRSRLVEELIEGLKIPMNKHPLSLPHTAFQPESHDLLASCCILLTTRLTRNRQPKSEPNQPGAIEVPVFTGDRFANIYLG